MASSNVSHITKMLRMVSRYIEVGWTASRGKSVLNLGNPCAEKRVDTRSSRTNNTESESTMSSSVKTSFVTKPGTHFCYKCGWIDDIEVTMERKEYTDSKTGEVDVSHFFIKTDKNLECPECKKRTVKPLTSGNSIYAIEYLLRALR
jgi:hypothetical protein